MTDPYKRAKKKVKQKKGFYGHLVTYITVNAFMIFMITVTEGGNPFINWGIPMAGWGIGLASHYFRVFGLPFTGIGGSDWEDKEIEKELNKEGYSLDQFEESEEGLELKELEDLEPEPEVAKRPWKDEDMV